MEFACGFVYVPPSLSRREVQRSGGNAAKRSALLPPVKAFRPRRAPPPPPPTQPADPQVKAPPSPKASSQKTSGQQERNQKVGSSKPVSLFNRPELQPRPEADSSPATPSRKTALLPPFIKPAANPDPNKQPEPPQTSSNNIQSLWYVDTKHESGPNMETTEDLYSYTLPEGRGGEAKLPPDRGIALGSALLPPFIKPAANPDPNKQPEPPQTSSNNIQSLWYVDTKHESGPNMETTEDLYSYTLPEGRGGEAKLPPDRGIALGSAPPLPPRPSFMPPAPEYVMVLPAAPPSSKPPLPASKDKGPLPGNPNIVLISLGKLLSEEREVPSHGKPIMCSECGSVLDSEAKNQVKVCYFCQSEDLTRPSRLPVSVQKDDVFLLNPGEQPQSTADSLLLFCIDTSGSMSITSEVSESGQNIQRTRLEFVQEAVLQCVRKLSHQRPEVRVGLITFNFQVTVYECSSFQLYHLSGAELNDRGFLMEAAAGMAMPLPLSQTKDYLERHISGLSANGETALGPAALVAVSMASRLPGSKVIICTDGKANAKLGNLEDEDNDARALLSSTIFYQNLGESAATQGVTVSVLSIEGTDCRLDELGRLADRTGGKVVIASPNQLHSEFEEIIENRTVATHCAVTLLVPKSLRLKGEREVGHKGTREVGNVNTDTEVTMQFGAQQHTEVAPPACGSRVAVQLQVRYRRNGQALLRVFTAEREVTDDSSAALSSLSLAIVQLSSLQASAALAVRGRFLDARKEGAEQRRLIERAIEQNQRAEDQQMYQDWVRTMEPINHNIHTLARRSALLSYSEPLTDAGAALFITMKHSNRTSM
ncbi:circularly permutated Ras protein 1-like isoform X1 [Xiphophorus maculatus]|uniref:circularly permutated Ras protein 1-like isoform X1 n=2 Tax=Xiphophorus maculatus TaxID=8083 RepID=UPI000C6E0992|nr:circularly permutated Ras protein 1-like isoform X1 [Xiphophorus maculatus]